MKRIISSAWLPLVCFMSYCFPPWDGLSGMNLLYGALVTIILIIVLYLYPIQQTIKHRSVIWWLGVIMAIGLFVAGFALDFFEFKLEAEIYGAWGNYIWFFSLFTLLDLLCVPKEAG